MSSPHISCTMVNAVWPTTQISRKAIHERPSCYISGMTSLRTCPTEPKQTSSWWTLQRHSTSWDTGDSCGNSPTMVLTRRCSSGYKASCLTGNRLLYWMERNLMWWMLSGVPQCSVLGPCLFLYYISDIPVGLESTVRLIADDTITYLTVTSVSDARTLQQDLHKLGDWYKKWHMEFHPAKCEVLTVSRKRNPIHYEYKLSGHILEHATSAKYLGVTFTSDMRWGQHVNITSKVKKNLNFICRNLQISSPKLKTTAYMTLVRPLRVRTVCMCRRTSRKWRLCKGAQRYKSPTGTTTHLVSETCWTICNGPRWKQDDNNAL